VEATGRTGRRAPETARVTEREDLAVGLEEPVPATVGRGDRRGEGCGLRAGRAVVHRIAEGVDLACRRDDPIAAAGRVGHNGDRCAATTANAGTGPGEGRITESEHPAVGGHHE